MKKQKWISLLFGLLAALLIAGAVLLSLSGRNMPVALLALSDSAEDCTVQFADKLNGGDLEGALTLIAGNISTSFSDEEASVLSDALWQWYLDSITVEFPGDCYATDAGICRDAVVEAMSIPDVLAILQERATGLLSNAVATVGEAYAYNEEGGYREEFVMETLRDGIAEILAEGDRIYHREITLQLVYENSQWRILPDPALVEILSGGMRK